MAKRGPKKKYKPEYDHQAFIACKKGGLIDLDLAELFGVCEKTIYTWKNDYPSFKSAVQEGKDYYDCARAEESLKKLVEGYDYQEERIITAGDGKVIRKEMTKKHVSPNPGSVCFFLKNRNPERWRDMKAVEITGRADAPLYITDLSKLTDEELERLESIASKIEDTEA